MKRYPRLLLVVLSLITFTFQAQAQTLRVARVIDGDTFEMSDGTTVRLIGIDAPETYATSKLDRDVANSGQSQETIRALGRRATTRARQIAEGQIVRLEYDQANVATNHRDRYGRVLAYVWVGSIMVNERLIQDGYASVYTNYPFEHMERFRKAERTARAVGSGLWGEPSGLETTPEGTYNGYRLQVGSQGGCYYTTASGNKSYVDRSLCTGLPAVSKQTTAKQPAVSSGATHTPSGQQIHTGPRGGKYVITKSGKKRYLPKN